MELEEEKICNQILDWFDEMEKKGLKSCLFWPDKDCQKKCGYEDVTIGQVVLPKESFPKGETSINVKIWPRIQISVISNLLKQRLEQKKVHS